MWNGTGQVGIAYRCINIVHISMKSHLQVNKLSNYRRTKEKKTTEKQFQRIWFILSYLTLEKQNISIKEKLQFYFEGNTKAALN